jgi:hypothetical protein
MRKLPGVMLSFFVVWIREVYAMLAGEVYAAVLYNSGCARSFPNIITSHFRVSSRPGVKNTLTPSLRDSLASTWSM